MSVNQTTAPARVRTRARAVALLGLVAVAATVLLVQARPEQRAVPLRVTSGSVNPAIATTTLDYLARRETVVTDRSAHAATYGAALGRLHVRPRVLGMLHPRRNVVVAVTTDDVRLDDGTFEVYTIVTLVNEGAGYVPTDATTICHVPGAGVWVGFDVPGHEVVLAVDTPTGALAPFGSGVRSAGAAMEAWSDPHLAVDETLVHRLGDATACP